MNNITKNEIVALLEGISLGKLKLIKTFIVAIKK